MNHISRRALLGTSLAGISALAVSRSALALTESLTDIGGSMLSPPPATIFTAREIVTLDPARPAAQAVAVVNGRILWVGSLEEVKAVLGDQPYTIDETFVGRSAVPDVVCRQPPHHVRPGGRTRTTGKH